MPLESECLNAVRTKLDNNKFLDPKKVKITIKGRSNLDNLAC